MGEWKKSFNKDYHFITIQNSTEKNYGHQFMLSCSGIVNIFMAIRSITQSTGSLLNIESLNLSAHYWNTLCASLELTTLNVGISTYSKNNVTTTSEFYGAHFPITINGKRSEVSDMLLAVVQARAGVARINTSTMQATV